MRVGHLTFWLSSRGGGIPAVIAPLARAEQRVSDTECQVFGLLGRAEPLDSDEWEGVAVRPRAPVDRGVWGYAPGLVRDLLAANLDLVHHHGVWRYDETPEQARLSKRDEYVAKMKRQLDEWSAEMDALEARAQEAQDAAERKYEEQLSALRTQRLAGEKKLEAVQTATEDSWERLKAETDNVWEAFKDSVQAFKAHFK